MTEPRTPLTDKPGHCFKCGALLWRTAEAVRTLPGQNISAGMKFLLWPIPGGVYARIETPTGWAPGIPFCRACAPLVDHPWNYKHPQLPPEAKVLGFEAHNTRYLSWFRASQADFYRAWLRDALSLDDNEIEEYMTKWVNDGGEVAQPAAPALS